MKLSIGSDHAGYNYKEEVKKYLEGNPLEIENDTKGFVLLKWKNKSVDIAKSDTHIIKNYYPKGLRKKFD